MNYIPRVDGLKKYDSEWEYVADKQEDEESTDETSFEEEAPSINSDNYPELEEDLGSDEGYGGFDQIDLWEYSSESNDIPQLAMKIADTLLEEVASEESEPNDSSPEDAVWMTSTNEK